MISAEIDTSRLIRRLDQLRSRDIPRAVGTALSRSGRTVRARVQRLIREDLNLKAAQTRDAIKLERSNAVDGPSRASITLRARGGPIPLRDFGAKMTTRGATFKVRRRDRRRVYVADGRKGFIIGQRDNAGRLISTTAAFGGHVFTRTEARGLRKIYGPGIAIKVAGRRARTLAADTFRERFRAELNAVLREFIRRQETAR